MLFLIAAASLIFQDSQAIQDQAESVTDIPVEEQVQPIPTDAPTLIAHFDAIYQSRNEIIAEHAARKARERYLRTLLLPVLSRTDLDDGARGDILRETRDTFDVVETSNADWALGILQNEDYFALNADHPGMASEILEWAERHNDSEGVVLTALEPLAVSGLYDASRFAERVDLLSVAQNRPQIYGSQQICEAGIWTEYPVMEPDQLDSRREALDLPSIAEFRDEQGTSIGENCEISPSP